MNRYLLLLGLSFGFIQTSFAAETDCDKFTKTLTPNSYGWVDVPEDWSSKNPSTKKIKVFYYTYHLEETVNASPLAYFNGGPGGAAHGIDGYIVGKSKTADDKPNADKDHHIAQAYQKIPFVFIDQRGTGCSTPLEEVKVDKNGKMINPGKHIRTMALYGPRAIVMDAEAVRTKLGLNKWRIFGQSYGSMIVHRYIELAPQSLIAAFAHGAAVMSDGVEWTIMRTRAFKRVGDEYFKVYPGDRELINHAREIFPKDYCVSMKYKICGAPLLDDLGWSYLSFKDFGYWETLHGNIRKLFLPEEGDLPTDISKLTLNQKFIDSYFKKKSDHSTYTSDLLVDVVPARETPGGQCNTWSCALAIPKMEANGEYPMDYEFNECRNMLAIQRNFDYNLIKKEINMDYPSLRVMKQNLEQYPIKFFLYSGELDTFGAEETFAQEVEYFGDKVKYTKYLTGHGAFFEEEQTWKDILSTQPAL